MDASSLQVNAEQPESKEAASAYERANAKIKMENRFKYFSFGIGWTISIIFFAYAIYLMCRLLGCIQLDACKTLVMGSGVLPYWTGFILLAAALGFSLSLAVLRYSFPVESKSDRLHDSIPLTPPAKVIAEFLDAVLSYFKKTK